MTEYSLPHRRAERVTVTQTDEVAENLVCARKTRLRPAAGNDEAAPGRGPAGPPPPGGPPAAWEATWKASWRPAAAHGTGLPCEHMA